MSNQPIPYQKSDENVTIITNNINYIDEDKYIKIMEDHDETITIMGEYSSNGIEGYKNVLKGEWGGNKNSQNENIGGMITGFFGSKINEFKLKKIDDIDKKSADEQGKIWQIVKEEYDVLSKKTDSLRKEAGVLITNSKDELKKCISDVFHSHSSNQVKIGIILMWVSEYSELEKYELEILDREILKIINNADFYNLYKENIDENQMNSFFGDDYITSIEDNKEKIEKMKKEYENSIIKLNKIENDSYLNKILDFNNLFDLIYGDTRYIYDLDKYKVEQTIKDNKDTKKDGK